MRCYQELQIARYAVQHLNYYKSLRTMKSLKIQNYLNYIPNVRGGVPPEVETGMLFD